MHHRKTRIKATGHLSCKALALAVAIAACLPVHAAAAEPDGTADAVVHFDIPAGDLALALERFSTQSGVQAMYRQELVAGKRAPAVNGALAPAAALARLLANSGVTSERVNARTFVLKEAQLPTRGDERPVQTQERRSGGERLDDTPKALAAVLVKGSRSLNADIERSENDIQPYVVFAREDIERSMAVNIEEFLGTRLPMNQTRGTASRNEPGNAAGNRSKFDLRGLGANQTLILINGRRAPSVSMSRTSSDLDQPDLNGIPISAVERIEVLPATASGIYGGGATGGVINVVLRKDYEQTLVRVSYDNSFDTDSARRKFDISTGLSSDDGKTNLVLAASYMDANTLLSGDRPFAERARALALGNNPGAIHDPNHDIQGRYTNFASVDGSPLVFDDGTPFGAATGSVPVGYAGVASDGGAGLLAGAGAYNVEIPRSLAGARQGLFSAPTTYSAYGALTHEVSERVNVYLDIARNVNKSLIPFAPAAVLTATLPATSTVNPFNQAIRVRTGLTGHETDYMSDSVSDRVNAGLNVLLPREWSVGLDLNWSRSANTFTNFGQTYDRTGVQLAMWSGQFDLLRDLEQYPPDLTPYWIASESVYGPAHSHMKEATVRASGPVVRLPAGAVTMTTSLSSRRNSADASYTGDGPYQYHPARHQDVDSVYAEAAIPVVSRAQDMRFIRSLQAQVSVRRDAYSTVSVPPTSYLSTPDRATVPPFTYASNRFSSTDYTVGLRYEPVDTLAFRISHGTGFLPPNLTQIAGSPMVTGLYVADPRRSGLSQLVAPVSLIVAGGNEALTPEQSRSTSAGLIFSPGKWDWLRFSIDYTRIEKSDEITLLSYQQIVDMEDSFPGRVIRGPNLAADPAGWAGPITAIDASAVNVASSLVEAFDIQMDAEKSLGRYGLIHLYAVATVQTALERKVFSDDQSVDRVGYSDGPLRWRGNIGANWQLGNLRAAVNTQFYDEYKVFGSYSNDSVKQYAVLMHGSDRVPSQAYTDASIGYKLASGPLSGLDLVFGLKNIFNKQPPIIGSLATTAGYSTYGDPRLRSYMLSAEYAF